MLLLEMIKERKKKEKMSQLRIEVLQAWKRCLKVTGNVFKNDPPALAIVRSEAKAEFLKNKNLTSEAEIREKIEEAHGGTTVIEKFVLQVVQSDHDPNHYVANMRPEMEFLELSGTPYGREDHEADKKPMGPPVIEPKIKRVRRQKKTD